MSFDREKAIRAYEQIHNVNISDGEDAAVELVAEWFFPKRLVQGEIAMKPDYEAAMEIREAIVGATEVLERIAHALEFTNHWNHTEGCTDSVIGCPLCDNRRRVESE